LSRKGYLAAFVGTLVGGAAAGSAVGALLFLIPCDENGFECLGVAIFALLGGAAAALTGGMLGCYLALRLRRHEGAGRTSWLLLGLVVAASVAFGVIGNTGAIDDSVGPAVAIVGYLALPLVARWLVVRDRNPRSEAS
jgi:hypothetical protein